MVSRKQELDRLDDVIRQLDERIETPQGLMREHLTVARTYIVDEMPDELKMQLELVRGGITQLEDSGLRSRIDELLHALESNAAARPR